ncbi:unnamed protein product [Effrenium voratum]|nr:unnamed protein product [Effrenium voratum]
MMMSSVVLLVLSVVPQSFAAHCAYPGGECYELKFQECKGASNWTLHGLWPEWKNGCPGPKFDASILEPIRNDMEMKWRSCPEFGDSNEKFWEHEWEKHGTCTNMTQLAFFKKGLQLHDQYQSSCQQTQDDTPECQVCFSQDFSTKETCPKGASEVLV